MGLWLGRQLTQGSPPSAANPGLEDTAPLGPKNRARHWGLLRAGALLMPSFWFGAIANRRWP